MIFEPDQANSDPAHDHEVVRYLRGGRDRNSTITPWVKGLKVGARRFFSSEFKSGTSVRSLRMEGTVWATLGVVTFSFAAGATISSAIALESVFCIPS